MDSAPFEQVRDEFETVRRGVVFLNHAGVSPLPRRAADAMKRAVEANRALTVDDWAELEAGLARCRDSIARMVNADPDEIAFSRNTTEGINWVANGLDWRPGDRVVTVSEEYPANIYPWMRLRGKGVELHMVQPVDHRVPLERLAEAITPSTRLVALSFVEFASGFRFDLEAVGELCREKGVFFLVDLIQGLGALRADLGRAGVSFASCGAQKWLLGPVGAGFFYCAREHAGALEAVCVGADTVERKLPYLDYDYTPRADARRFEYSTPATHAVHGMAAALDLFLEQDRARIESHIRLLTDILIDGAVRKGYECRSPRGGNEWSGIAALRHPTRSAGSVIAQLAEKNVFTREREGYIRLAPHFYQTAGEMERAVDAL